MENQEKNHRRKKKKNSYSRSSQRVFTKKYGDENVERLKRLIQNHSQRGEDRYFAIKVDGEFCVNKTANSRFFDDYKEFIDGSTESIEVIMYFGKSNNCNRHIFYLKDNLLGNAETIDVDKKISDALKKKDQEHLIQSLQEKVERQEALIEEMDEELEDLRSKTDLREILKEGISMIGVLKGNSKVDPGLSGVKKPEPEAEVEVEIVKDVEEKQQSEEEKTETSRQKNLFDSMYNQFGEKGVRQVVTLMMALAKSDNLRKGINRLMKEERENPPNDDENHSENSG